MNETFMPWWRRHARTIRWIVGISLLSMSIITGWLVFYKTPSHAVITPYQPQDRSAILEMLRTDWYWLVGEGVVDFSPEYMLDHHAATFKYPDNSLSIMVYRDEQNNPIGFITYHKLEALKGRIQFLAIARHARKKGFAQKLLTHAIDVFKSKGFCLVEIAVRINNIPAKTLYLKNGFTEIWRTEDGFLGLSKSLCP